MDRGAWQATVHGIARVRHDLNFFLFFLSFSFFLFLIKGVQYRKGEKEELVNMDNYFK